MKRWPNFSRLGQQHGPRTRRQQGFTLLELIVALALSALVAMVGTVALSMSSDFYARNHARAQARESVRAVERILRHEWAGRGLRVDSDGAMLEFDTVHPLQLPAGATSLPPPLPLARVRYRCEPPPPTAVAGRGGWSLVYQVFALPPPATMRNLMDNTPPPKTESSTPTVLASQLQVCAFSFLLQSVNAQGQPEPRWVKRWDPTQPPPALLRLALSGLHSDVPPVVYTAERDGAR